VCELWSPGFAIGFGVLFASFKSDFQKLGGHMKKLVLSLIFLSLCEFGGLSGTAIAATNSVSTPQFRIEVGQRRRRWRNRGYATGNRIGYGRTFSRDVQRGWRLYRETYQVRYLPNGLTQTVLISRVRIR
jgi:hypothetical protein